MKSFIQSSNKFVTICTILFSALAGGCGYGSRYEAKDACRDWVRGNDFTFEVRREALYNVAIPYSNRKCENEIESRTVLGFEAIGVEENKVYEDGEVGPSYRLKKRFNY